MERVPRQHMKAHRLIIISLVLLVAASAFAHGGHKHQYLGFVKSVQANDLVVTTTDKHEMTFTLTQSTAFSGGTRADLTAGTRVSVYVENDGKTAKTIKLAK